jgi:hypothetical protein
MAYETKDILNMIKTYHEVEICSKEFLLYAAWGMKYKEKIAINAIALLKAIEKYKKLPEEIRNELEKDKNNHVSNIIELEKACKKVIN